MKEGRFITIKKALKGHSKLQKEQFAIRDIEITELKEQFNEHLHGEYVLRDVLQKLLTHIPYKTFDFEDEKQYYNEDYNSKNFITNLLEELDGKKEFKPIDDIERYGKSEKKEDICKINCNRVYDEECNPCPHKEVSGGEKDCEHPIWQDIFDSTQQICLKCGLRRERVYTIDSKPPEPHKDCELCKHGRINRSGIPCETCSCWSNFEPIEDRLPGGTGVVVKREERLK